MNANSILESVGALYSLFTAAVMVVPGMKISLESTRFSYLIKVSRKKSSIPTGSDFFPIKTINWVSNQYLSAFTIINIHKYAQRVNIITNTIRNIPVFKDTLTFPMTSPLHFAWLSNRGLESSMSQFYVLQFSLVQHLLNIDPVRHSVGTEHREMNMVPTCKKLTVQSEREICENNNA